MRESLGTLTPDEMTQFDEEERRRARAARALQANKERHFVIFPYFFRFIV